MFRRQTVKTHGQLMREEAGEGFDHLRMAVAHAAGGTAGMIAPKMNTMRERLEPTVDRSMEMARDSARRANRIARRATGKKKESRMAKRWPMVLGGLMLAGVAMGAASALLSRRRQQKWNEYDSTGTVTGIRDEAGSIAESTRATASTMAAAGQEKTTDVLGQMKGTDTTAESGFTSGTTPGMSARNSRS